MSNDVKKKAKLKTTDLVYIGIFAALIAVCAWLSIPMAIPFTLQTFAVCLTAALLGAKRGTLTIAIYILLGMIGVPVFTGFKSGIAVITGPTGGYVAGFIFTALIIGFAADKLGSKLWITILSMIIGVATCYLFGTVWYMIAYKTSFVSALSLCVVPFILPDLVKIILAAVLTGRLKKFIK